MPAIYSHGGKLHVIGFRGKARVIERSEGRSEWPEELLERGLATERKLADELGELTAEVAALSQRLAEVERLLKEVG